ncbi:crosslink repair DNA glycosylase YcaQ family protein [Nocardioides sp.]|uniref:winged helix-turn-helix domain-containing protein n=1 Tax=Nocardioides sp. TaxID=35761 RepID=UPI00260F296F|nr:crosslink repair DNA glycosylase YcaQ family protein [Nocardioides sp.]
MESLALAQARRIALAAQGFADAAHERPTMRTLSRTLERTGVLQVDSVNVLQRAHYMPLYSRMGPYDTDLVRRASEQRPRRMVEYWAHVQAFMPVDLWPVMAHRMAYYRERRAKWSRAVPRPVMCEVLAAVRDSGPVTAKQIDSGAPRAKEHWGWNWSQARLALDALYMAGEIAIAGRSTQFEPRYDLPERVIPAVHLEAPTPTRLEADTELVRRAARSHGVATARDLADYYRMSAVDTRAGLAVLLESGEVSQVQVEGWRTPGYLWHQARMPRRISARTFLSPFDPVVWERSRTESLFDFHYRIEIYTPAHKRVHGYYVLPFLLGDRIVGRVDLKADRRRGTLVVKGAFAEPGAPESTAEELGEELTRLAGWLGLDRIEVDPETGRGELLSRLSVRG